MEEEEYDRACEEYEQDRRDGLRPDPWEYLR